MSDPRNVAHDKKVKQVKNDESPVDAKKAAAQPNEKAGKAPDAPAASQGSPDLDQSVAVLSKLKEMEFHSRANIETLAELTLTIDDELKQKEFSDPIGGLYSAQDQFQTKITELIQGYESHVETLKPAV
ncbi:MAG: hypothetical protein ABIU29_02585 [Chthoniobacterales bacterium]